MEKLRFIFVLSFLYQKTLTDKDDVTVTGAGPERFVTVMNALMPTYLSYRDPLDPTVKVNFDFIVVNQSLARIILLNSTISRSLYPDVTYVVTESLILPSETTSFSDIKGLPLLIGTLVFPFNLPGINELRLTSSTIAKIFSNQITRWNDASIQAFNPTVTLPDKPIKLVLRLDKTDHTMILTTCCSSLSLTTAGVNWKIGRFDSPNMTNDLAYSQAWKRYANDTYFMSGAMGVASLTASVPFTLTYTHPRMAIHWKLPILSTVYNPALYLTKQDIDALTAWTWAIETYMENGTKNAIVPDTSNASTAKISYPFYLYNWVYFNVTITSQKYCRQLAELILFTHWILQDPAALAMAMEMDMVPLSLTAATFFETAVINRLNCASEKIFNIIQTLMNAKENDTAGVIIISGGDNTVLFVCLGASGAVYKWYTVRKEVYAKPWFLTEHDLKEMENDAKSQMSFHTLTSVDRFDKEEKITWDYYYNHTARCQGRQAILFRSGSARNPLAYKYNTCWKLNFLLKSVHNSNVVNFLGIAFKDRCIYHVFEHVGKHRLHDVLAKSPYDLNDDIKYSLTKDVALGMKYLHKHGQIHGLLDSWNVVLDNNWTAKVINWAQCLTAVAENEFAYFVGHESKWDSTKISEETFKRLLFRHPEFLQGIVNNGGAELKHDLYSFSMVTVEIFTRELPYFETMKITGGWRRVLETVAENGVLPFLTPNIPNIIKTLQQHLTQKSPQMTFDGVVAYLTMHQPTRRGVVDTLLETMEEYMQTLEEKVEERTGELKTVTEKMEHLLLSMLPHDVAVKLQNGQSVEPEYYESVTVYFSDVVSFTTFCGESTPLDVIKFLNALYTLFDSIIERVDVYKVETIGDAYMCVSGLPRRNGEAHAENIARMALALVDAMRTFEISHKSGESIRIRVGINSGSVMAGVVGVKMPRYCLFGDTVNVASRMESSSLANRIQISDTTAALLKKTNRFHMESRGALEVKGKGVMTTWWLNGVKN